MKANMNGMFYEQGIFEVLEGNEYRLYDISDKNDVIKLVKVEPIYILTDFKLCEKAIIVI